MSPESSVPHTTQADSPPQQSKEEPSVYVGYLAAAGEVVDDLGSDGAVHVGEEHLGMAVGGDAAVHHHQGALHSLSPPGVVFLRRSERECGPGAVAPHNAGHPSGKTGV